MEVRPWKKPTPPIMLLNAACAASTSSGVKARLRDACYVYVYDVCWNMLVTHRPPPHHIYYAYAPLVALGGLALAPVQGKDAVELLPEPLQPLSCGRVHEGLDLVIIAIEMSSY